MGSRTSFLKEHYLDRTVIFCCQACRRKTDNVEYQEDELALEVEDEEEVLEYSASVSSFPYSFPIVPLKHDYRTVCRPASSSHST